MRTSVLLAVCFLLLVTSRAFAAPADPRAGKALYQRWCVDCHGTDGRGGRMASLLPVTPPDLTDQEHMQSQSDRQLFERIKYGSTTEQGAAAMPAFAEQLSDTQIWDIVAYLRTLATQAAEPASTIATQQQAAALSPALSVARLRLSIWPEYDDPRVLVMLRGEMTPAKAFPTRIRLPLPKGAELIGAGMISAQNELLLHPHQIVAGETRDTLLLTLPVPRFFLEFYYDPWQAQTTEKRFAYTFSLPYPIAHLEVDIQQPLAATNFVTEPSATVHSTDSRGFTYHQFVYRQLKKGQVLTFPVRNVKPTPTPSLPKARPSSPAPVAAPGVQDYTVFAFGMLAVTVVLFSGGVFLWRRYQRRLPSTRASRGSEPGAARTPARPSRPNFCTNCGRRLQPQYRFCPGCGKALEPL